MSNRGVYHIAGSARGQYEANPVFWFLSALISGKEKSAWSGQVRNFWTMSAMKSQKAAEDSQTKENINDTRGFVLLQTQMAFFPGSRNTKRKLSLLILIKAKSVGNMISPLLIKLVRSRWLDISLVVSLRFYELTRSQVP